MHTLALAAERQRLDKWLWFARLVKTRREAVRLIEAGFVRIDARRVEIPSKLVGCGDVLTIAFERHVRVLRILDIAGRRGPSREARALFEEFNSLKGAFQTQNAERPREPCLPKQCKGDSNAEAAERRADGFARRT